MTGTVADGEIGDLTPGLRAAHDPLAGREAHGRLCVVLATQGVPVVHVTDRGGHFSSRSVWDRCARARPLRPRATESSGCGGTTNRGARSDGMIAKALHYKQKGYKAIKMQMAHTTNLRGDVDNVKRMREALGPDTAIMIDINQGWTADVAINQGRKIADYDVYWLEEPVPADDFKGYKRVAEALPIRIVGGETHFTRYDLRPFFENPCCPILQPDPMRGGYTDLRKISVLADTWGLQMAPHLFPELNVQLLASIPNGAWIEDMGLSEDLWVEPVKVINGTITAPERPGHGLAFRPEILKDCRVA